MRWHPTSLEVGRDIHSNRRGIALEYRICEGHIMAVVVCFPADHDADLVRSLPAWVLSVMAPRHGVYTLMLRDLNANPGWALGFRMASVALTALWEDFLHETGLTWSAPSLEVPTWTHGRGCVGLVDRVPHTPAHKKGDLWVDEASPFPSDHRRSGTLGASSTQRAGPSCCCAPGITGIDPAALATARQERGARPENLEGLYAYFLASTIGAVESAHGPPHEFGELPGSVDQVQWQL